MSINKYTANQDIRDYMADHCVSQKKLAEELGASVWTMNKTLKIELPQKEKEDLIRKIDAIASEAPIDEDQEIQEETEETQQTEDESVSTKFQIGDRVKIPSKELRIGIVCDIWHSLIQDKLMYAVDVEGGSRGLYAEDQLEPAPLPIEYSFTATCEGNVAVVCMMAKQGEKTWVYARGHAHILHDGEVGMAQAISYAGKRMFEALDKKQENQIYFKNFKERGCRDDQQDQNQ